MAAQTVSKYKYFENIVVKYFPSFFYHHAQQLSIESIAFNTPEECSRENKVIFQILLKIG